MTEQAVSFEFHWQDADFPTYLKGRAIYSGRVFAAITEGTFYKVAQYLFLLGPAVLTALTLFLLERFWPPYGPSGTATPLHSAYFILFIIIFVATALCVVAYLKLDTTRLRAERATFDQVGEGPFHATIGPSRLHITTPWSTFEARSFENLEVREEQGAILVIHDQGFHMFPMRDLPDGLKSPEALEAKLRATAA